MNLVRHLFKINSVFNGTFCAHISAMIANVKDKVISSANGGIISSTYNDIV